jgi:hypothetical protein
LLLVLGMSRAEVLRLEPSGCRSLALSSQTFGMPKVGQVAAGPRCVDT